MGRLPLRCKCCFKVLNGDIVRGLGPTLSGRVEGPSGLMKPGRQAIDQSVRGVAVEVERVQNVGIGTEWSSRRSNLEGASWLLLPW